MDLGMRGEAQQRAVANHARRGPYYPVELRTSGSGASFANGV
jgi:hypothetical protein